MASSRSTARPAKHRQHGPTDITGKTHLKQHDTREHHRGHDVVIGQITNCGGKRRKQGCFCTG